MPPQAAATNITTVPPAVCARSPFTMTTKWMGLYSKVDHFLWLLEKGFWPFMWK